MDAERLTRKCTMTAPDRETPMTDADLAAAEACLDLCAHHGPGCRCDDCARMDDFRRACRRVSANEALVCTHAPALLDEVKRLRAGPVSAPWEELSEPDREVDRRIGEALYAAGRASRDEEVAQLRAEVDAARKDQDLWHYTAKLGDRTVAQATAAVEGIGEQRDAALASLATLRADVARLTRERDDYARQLDAYRRERGDGDPGIGA